MSHLFGEVRDAGPDPDVSVIFVSAMGSDTFLQDMVSPEAHTSAAEINRSKHRLYTIWPRRCPELRSAAWTMLGTRA